MTDFWMGFLYGVLAVAAPIIFLIATAVVSMLGQGDEE